MNYPEQFSTIINDIVISTVSEVIISSGGYILTFVSVLIAFVFVYKFIMAFLSDNSFKIGGFYLRDVPYKGYNRWHSREWNMKNTMK